MASSRRRRGWGGPRAALGEGGRGGRGRRHRRGRGRRGRREITAAGGRALDCRQSARILSRAIIVRRTANAFGGLDFVWTMSAIRPASIEGTTWPISEIAIDLNLHHPGDHRGGVPELRARGGGALLYTVSTSASSARRFSPVYSMAKFGVVGFVRSLAKRPRRQHPGQRGRPGPIDTPMLRLVARPDQQQAGGGTRRRWSSGAPADPAPHRETRGNRQRRAVPPLRRSILRVGRGLAVDGAATA